MEFNKKFSGIIPELSVSNNSSNECGIGATAVWANKLWFITYPSHAPEGSDDKLYSLDKNLNMNVYPQSVGGTHAGRMIHQESNQLIIGPYFINKAGEVRVINPEKMPGRLTAIMRHLKDPENKVYFYGMEGEFYEADVNTLKVKNIKKPDLPGTHGKGGYTSQNRIVISHNGQGGCLAEWDGKNWNIVDENKYTEVTGPGGINAHQENDILWAVGWDKRSVILKLLENEEWVTYRLPKGSYTHDADHGWYTEWPRIRKISDKRLLLDMHGILYEFPRNFKKQNISGINPLATHLKMIVDFTEWNNQLVMGCNDASEMQNPLVGTPQSNFWFTSLSEIKKLPQPIAWGGPWVKDKIQSGIYSEPFHFAGYEKKILHIKNDGEKN